MRLLREFELDGLAVEACRTSIPAAVGAALDARGELCFLQDGGSSRQRTPTRCMLHSRARARPARLVVNSS
jgi:hypothetical protein